MSSNVYPSGFSPPYMLRVSTRTWMRDSHDLFDYETHQQLKVSHFATSSALKLLRSDSDVTAIEYNNMVEKEHDHLLSIISKRSGEYIVMPAEKMPGSLLYPQKLWLIVRTLPYQRYALQENDIIKLGRFRLRVKQLVPGPPNETQNSGSGGETTTQESSCEAQLVKLFDGVIPEKTITFEEQVNMQCRICLAEGYLQNPLSGSNTASNTPVNSTSNETSIDADTSTTKMTNNGITYNINSPSIKTGGTNINRTMSNISDLNTNKGSFDSDRLICACECKGSIKYVHVDCLRKWIDSRWNLKTDEPLPSMVFIREVSCELCKSNYPCFIRQNGELIQIVKMPRMSVPFLVLENITPHAVKGVHLLSMKEMKDLKLGRGHESDVRIPDVSISRYHATIRYEQGQFFLEDHDSKFGTLVAMRKPRLVSLNEPLSVQVGRSVINLTIDESLPYLQNSVITLSSSVNTTPSITSDQMETVNLTKDNINNNNSNNNNNNNNNLNNVNVEGERTMLQHQTPINSGEIRQTMEFGDYPVHQYRYPTYYPFQSQSGNTTTIQISNQMVITPSPTVSSNNTPTNLISTMGNGSGVASNTPTSMMSVNSPTNLQSNSGSNMGTQGNNGANIPEIYWNIVRNAQRNRYENEGLGVINNNNNNNNSNNNNNNNRMSSYRVGGAPGPSSSRGGDTTMSNNNSQVTSSNLGTTQIISNTLGQNSREEVEMMLPESVFIANWNSLPTRNIDPNGDTSTSALEHRHSGQDMDKPVTRM